MKGFKTLHFWSFIKNSLGERCRQLMCLCQDLLRLPGSSAYADSSGCLRRSPITLLSRWFLHIHTNIYIQYLVILAGHQIILSFFTLWICLPVIYFCQQLNKRFLNKYSVWYGTMYLQQLKYSLISKKEKMFKIKEKSLRRKWLWK